LGDNTIVLVVEVRPLHGLSATWRAPPLYRVILNAGILRPFRSGVAERRSFIRYSREPIWTGATARSEFLHEQLDISDKGYEAEQYAIERSTVRQMIDLNPSEKRLTPLRVRLSVFASSDFSISNKNPEGS